MTTKFLKQSVLTLGLTVVLLACGDSVSKKEYKSPDEEFGELFKEVQLKAIFSDSKIFADASPKGKVEDVMKRYEEEKAKPNFNLKRFAMENFTFTTPNSKYVSKAELSPQEHVNELWSVLTRRTKESSGTLIPLVKSYLVQSGAASETYYWDNYFIMLGLQAAGKDTLMANTVLNFAQLIQDYGHVPTGNRSYYFSRSQPPFFASMVKMLAETKGYEDKLIKTLPQIQKEYQYWMGIDKGSDDAQKQNEARKKGEKAYRKVVFIGKNDMLNRYFDDNDTPRPEAYREDILFASKISGRKANQVYRDLRSGIESGWNFSSRWLRDGQNMSTIHTTDILPVDLNAILYDLELKLASIYEANNQTEYAQSMKQLANKRKVVFDKYFWNESAGFYFDYDFMAGKQTDVYSLAAVYPLFFKLASQAQAEKVAKVLESQFLKEGGLMTTLNQTSQQWDGANGFAPLQYLAIQGLRNYGFNDLANRIKQNWVANNLKVYKATGKMLDKYNVSGLSGGDYPRQDGYGWTNGVLLKLLSEK